MALLPRLRRLLGRPAPASRIGARRPTAAPRHGDVPQEDALRSRLGDDPNDERAFAALAEIVRRHAVTGVDDDPLTAEADDAERQRAADLAVWSLGEELAGNPRAWYPLVEVARLSVRDDLEGTLRRLTSATPRARPWSPACGCCARRGCPSRRWASAPGTGTRRTTTRRSGASWCWPPSRPTGRSTRSSTSRAWTSTRSRTTSRRCAASWRGWWTRRSGTRAPSRPAAHPAPDPPTAESPADHPGPRGS